MPVGGRWYPKSAECEIIPVFEKTMIGDAASPLLEFAEPGEFIVMGEFGATKITASEMFEQFICVEAPELSVPLIGKKDLE